MFENWATLYDDIYAQKGKRYDREVAYLESRISAVKTSPGRRLLDLACGTGEHLKHFQERFTVIGLDASPAMIEVARKKLPSVPIWQGDMTTFDLGQQWNPVDIITCLFSSIGYLASVDELHLAVARMAGHLAPGGVILIEPAVLPERLVPPRESRLKIQSGKRVVHRETSAKLEGRVLKICFRYEVRSGSGVREAFTDRHSLFSFSRDEYESAFTSAQLGSTFDSHGPNGLGLFVATRP